MSPSLAIRHLWYSAALWTRRLTLSCLPRSRHADCNVAQDAIARGDELAMQTNRFNPTDPFTATDPAPK